MSLTKKGFSALEIQRLIEHKRYEPIWLMLHKIRICMGNRNDKYTLDGYIEMDEGFFEGSQKETTGWQYEAAKMVDRSATVLTDGKPCYNTLKNICVTHEKIVVPDKKQVSKIFPWVHIAISNAKKKLLGLHHQVKDNYMQNYLNEFCYKFNRRFLGQALFERILVATLQQTWYKPNYG